LKDLLINRTETARVFVYSITPQTGFQQKNCLAAPFAEQIFSFTADLNVEKPRTGWYNIRRKASTPSFGDPNETA